MTIRDIAQQTGLTHQAVYKRLKANGVTLDTLKDKQTGQFTPEGEAVIRDLFALANTANATDATEVARLTTQVAELTTEVEKLRNQVATLENERDFLRVTLEREQQLHGITLTKIPTPPTALPEGRSEPTRGRLKTLWDKMRGRM